MNPFEHVHCACISHMDCDLWLPVPDRAAGNCLCILKQWGSFPTMLVCFVNEGQLLLPASCDPLLKRLSIKKNEFANY